MKEIIIKMRFLYLGKNSVVTGSWQEKWGRQRLLFQCENPAFQSAVLSTVVPTFSRGIHSLTKTGISVSYNFKYLRFRRYLHVWNNFLVLQCAIGPFSSKKFNFFYGLGLLMCPPVDNFGQHGSENIWRTFCVALLGSHRGNVMYYSQVKTSLSYIFLKNPVFYQQQGSNKTCSWIKKRTERKQ